MIQKSRKRPGIELLLPLSAASTWHVPATHANTCSRVEWNLEREHVFAFASSPGLPALDPPAPSRPPAIGEPGRSRQERGVGRPRSRPHSLCPGPAEEVGVHPFHKLARGLHEARPRPAGPRITCSWRPTRRTSARSSASRGTSPTDSPSNLGDALQVFHARLTGSELQAPH